VAFVGGEFRKRINGICLPVTITYPGSVDIRKYEMGEGWEVIMVNGYLNWEQILPDSLSDERGLSLSDATPEECRWLSKNDGEGLRAAQCYGHKTTFRQRLALQSPRDGTCFLN